MVKPTTPRKAAPRHSEVSINSARDFELAINGYAIFQALYAAAKLGIFSYLSENPNSTPKKIERALGLSSHPLRILLLSCCSINLLSRDEKKGTYQNSPMAELRLSKHSPRNMLQVLEAYHSIIYRPMYHLTGSIRNSKNEGLNEYPGSGKTLYERLIRHPRLETTFHQWMNDIATSSGIRDRLVPIILPILSRVTHVLDVGGGDGGNAMNLCKLNPALKVTIFDLPSICRKAKSNVKKNGLSDRIDFHSGNFLKDKFPTGVDAVYFSHITNIYSPEKNISLFKKSYKALSPGGALIIFGSISNDDETGSVSAAHLSLYFLCLATGEGMVYPLKEYKTWLKKSGFRKITLLPLDNGSRAFIIGIK